MDVGRNVVEVKAVVVFDRDVKASEVRFFNYYNVDAIVINGDFLVDVDIVAKFDVHVMGNIICHPDKTVAVYGELTCYKEIAGYNIWIAGDFYCEGSISADYIKVRDTFYCKSKIEAWNSTVTVLGELECKGIKAEKLELYGKAFIDGPVNAINSIVVGY